VSVAPKYFVTSTADSLYQRLNGTWDVEFWIVGDINQIGSARSTAYCLNSQNEVGGTPSVDIMANCPSLGLSNDDPITVHTALY